MLLVLDSNEYILGFGPSKKTSSKILLNTLLIEYPLHPIRIPRLIVDEVKNNISLELFREFINFVSSLTIIDENFSVPFELGCKYEYKGLKPADALIGAYTEWVGAEALVSENRHFLTLHTDLPFQILTAEKCIKLL